MTDVAATPATPRVTPTASMPVRIPWGDWAEQFLENETHVAEKIAETGIAAGLGMLPVGGVISAFIGPKIVDEYVDMGLTALEGVVKGQVLTIDSQNLIETTVLNLITKNVPNLAERLGVELGPMITSALAKRGIKLP